MEAKDAEVTNPEVLSDESNPVTEGISTEVINDENPEETSSEQKSVELANTAGNDENAVGTADNAEIMEGEEVALSAGETGGSPVSSMPVAGSVDDATEAVGENVTGALAAEETREADTEVEVEEASAKLENPPTSETLDSERLQELHPLTIEPGSDERSPAPQEEQNEGDEGSSKGSPESESSLSAEGREEAEERGRSIDYEKYMAEFHELQSEKDRLSLLNSQLQMKLVEYFRKKVGEEARSEKEMAVSDQEQRYLKYMRNMEELKREHEQNSEIQQSQIEEVRFQMQEKLDQVEDEWRAFMAKRDAAVKDLSQRRGKQAVLVEVAQIQAIEQRKENELVQVRLENIKLRKKTQRLEALLTANDELADGLHPIEIEQLKIENQTYEEKIEERNQDLLRLRKKVSKSVQMLTHITEKLQLLQEENQARREQLGDLDAVVASKRDVLNRTKQERDALRADNLQLRKQCGLLGNEVLLRDFEEKVDASESLKQRLEMLKQRHAELTLECSSIKRKLDQTKQMSLNPHTYAL